MSAWNPDHDIPDGPLTKPERRDTRRVLYWYERRAFFQAATGAWAKWIVGLPVAMLAFWQVIQLLAGHIK
jgi:hypothetical protein